MSAAATFEPIMTHRPRLEVIDETEISVTRVSKDDLDEVLDFIDTMYAHDAAYTAPLRALMRRKLSDKNPLFDPQSAEIALFVARRDDAIVGTVSALRDHKHERHQGEKTAFFGFFECVDGDVAQALIDIVIAQARCWDAEVLRGPRNLSRSEEVGVVVEGADKPSPMLAAHNDPRYAAMLKELGFVQHHDVLAYDISLYDDDGAPARYPQDLLDRANAVDIDGLELRPARWSRILTDLRFAHEVFVEAFRDVPENTPMSLRQFTSLGLGLLLFSDRNMLQLALVDGRPAGFALCFPEMNEALRTAGGKLNPRTAFRMLRAIADIETASFKLIGVMPEFRHTGLHAKMIIRAVDGCRDAGYRRIEASLIDARNKPMRKVVERIGMKIYKRWRMFDLAL